MCYCFPTFKDLLALLRHPFFERECKGKGRFIPSQIFSMLFEKNQRKNQNVTVKNLPLFFETDCKNKTLPNFNKFYFCFLFTPSSNLTTYFQELSRFFNFGSQR